LEFKDQSEEEKLGIKDMDMEAANKALGDHGLGELKISES
jgi:hypothetical protein